MNRHLPFACLFFLWPVAFISAQEVISIPYVPQGILFDGRVDEACWDTLSPMVLTTYGPTFGEIPTENSEVFLVYDDKYLYLVGRLFVARPEHIRATTYKRDAFEGTSDNFGIIIDSYNDKENALAFLTNPLAMRWDATVFNDAQAPPNEFPLSVDWNAFWDAMTWVSDSVWHAEMRIPFSTLRFQDQDGRVVMGVSVNRYIAALNETDIFPEVAPAFGMMGPWKPSQMQEVSMEGVRSRRPLYLAPYLLAGVQETAELDESSQFYHSNRQPKLEIGGDLKFGITSNFTVDLTVNTDFAQVEADDQQVNLTRFSLFFPEKRQFFLERASIFDFNFDQFNRLFYSRRIGLVENEPVRIYGGARLIGRAGNHDIGFLNMQTAAADTLHSENFTVLRTRHRILNQYSYIGSILTNRMDFQGRFNTAYGFDGLLRITGNDYLNFKWAQTFVDGATNKVLSLRPARIFLNWERRGYDGLTYLATFSRAGADYDPGIGFELREDYSSLRTRWQYGWTLPEKSKLMRLQVYVDGRGFQNNTSKIIETGIIQAGVNLEAKKSWAADVRLLYDHEFVPEAFDLTEEVGIPVGNYDFLQLEGFFQTPYTSFLSATITYNLGGFYDGTIASVGLMPNWKISPHFGLTGFYQFAYFSFPDRQQQAATHLARIKLDYLLNTKFSVAAFLQYNSQEEVFGANVRMRYNPREGHDLYVVFNDLVNDHRDREFPALPLHDNRTIVLKYTYTFVL